MLSTGDPSMATILIVKESVSLCDVMVRMFKGAGHRAICVHEGREAIAYIAAETVGLIILDLDLADMSGFDVLEAIRSTHSADARPILVYTASDAPADRRRAKELGASAYLTESSYRTDLLELASKLIKTSANDQK
jgi:CheY-like chemotaxis protein